MREQDCDFLIVNLFRTLDDVIVYRWQEYMHSGSRTIDNNPEILWPSSSRAHRFAHHDGEFDDEDDNSEI